MKRSNVQHSSVSSALLLIGLAASCSSGGGDGPGGGEGAFDVYLTDAPADELLSFQATIDALRLVGPGGPGANLLSGSPMVELLGLSGSQHWLVREDSLPQGTYDAVQLTLKPGSVAAKDKLGASVPVSVVSNTLVAPFSSPITVGASAKMQVLVDFDLAASLSGTATAPPLAFDPTGSSSIQSLSTSTTIDEIKGVVQSVNAAAQELVIDAFADGDLSVPLGLVTVAVTGSTLLIDDDGAQILSLQAFLNGLVVGSTLLEVHGAVQNQKVVAARIEVEDHLGGQGTEDLVKIEGLVLNLDPPAQAFDLLIIEIEKGAQVAGPVLSALGNPSTIPVEWTASTLFFESEHLLTTSAALAEGARIKVKFAMFGATPFLATRIELENGPDVEGRIVDTSGLPASIVIHVDGDEPAISSGQVASSSTPVSVDLGGSTLVLDTQQKPALQKNQLLVGLKIEAQEASISGPPSGPTITPQKTKVFAGRFKGHVTSIAPALSSFNASMSELKDPFGNTVSFGPVTVDIAPGCVFEDEANSQSGFFALFTGLGAGEALEIEVFGIGTQVANEILAYEVRAKVD